MRSEPRKMKSRARATEPAQVGKKRTRAGANGPRLLAQTQLRFLSVACAGIAALAFGVLEGSESGARRKPAELTQSAQPKQPAASPDFPLMAAARAGNAGRVKELLANGAAEDARNANLETSLFVAAALGHVDVVRILVDVPAGIDIADAEGRTPLFAAAAAGRRETVELLLDHGANPNSSRMNGESPLFVAVENRHIEVVRTLLKMGALPTVVDSRGRTPLQVARAQDNKEMAALLLTFRAQMPDKNTRATTHPRPDASPK